MTADEGKIARAAVLKRRFKRVRVSGSNERNNRNVEGRGRNNALSKKRDAENRANSDVCMCVRMRSTVHGRSRLKMSTKAEGCVGGRVTRIWMVSSVWGKEPGQICLSVEQRSNEAKVDQ